MDASYINSFVQGAQRVFASVCQETPSLGKVFIKTMPYVTSEVTVVVDISGDFEGEAVYNMKEDAGCFIASKMMRGFPVPSLEDDIAKSAVAELANIITGNVSTILAGKKILANISPPLIRIGANPSDFPFAAKVTKAVCVPLHFENGHIFEVDMLIP